MLSSANSLGGVTRILDHLAGWLGVAAFSSLSASEQDMVQDLFEMTGDELVTEADWKWAEREGSFTTKPGYATGTVTVTNDSATLTGASTLWNTNDAQGTKNVLADDKFTLGAAGSSYRITTVTSDTAITLATRYDGSTASAQTYQINRDEYELATGVWLLKRMWLLQPAYELLVVSRDWWLRESGGRYVRGMPTHAIILGTDTSAASTTMEQRVQLWPAPDDTYAITYTYRTLLTYPANNSEAHPQAMGMLLHGTMARICARRQMWDAERYHKREYDSLVKKFRRLDTMRGDYAVAMKGQFEIGEGPVRGNPTFPFKIT